MPIIGCDYHPGFQQIAFADKETGEFGERRLTHREEAAQFYRELKQRGLSMRAGMEFGGLRLHATVHERDKVAGERVSRTVKQWRSDLTNLH